MVTSPPPSAASPPSSPCDKPSLSRVVVVEGRNDAAAVRRAVEATVIVTRGFGLDAQALALMDKAYRELGLIILTDPDVAGDRIRRNLLRRYPQAAQAFLPRKETTKKGDVGVEHASPEAICRALLDARISRDPQLAPRSAAHRESYQAADLFAAGLAGGLRARERREAVGALLGIGGGNAKAFLRKLNGFAPDRSAFLAACRQVAEGEEKEGKGVGEGDGIARGAAPGQTQPAPARGDHDQD